MLAGLYLSGGSTGESISLSFPSSRVSAHLEGLTCNPLPPSSMSATLGYELLMLPSLWVSLPIPSSAFKGPSDYTGLTQTIQDNLPVLKAATGNPNSICNLKFTLPCNLMYSYPPAEEQEVIILGRANSLSKERKEARTRHVRGTKKTARL